MRERMHNVFIPSYEEKTVILSYLQDHALKSISPNEIPNTETTGAKLFQQKCSRCHALPDPNVHTASQWPDVVARMQLNTKKANLPELKKDEQDTIVKYLEKNAKKQ